MSSNAMEVVSQASSIDQWRSTKSVLARVQAISHLMKEVLQEGTDYGKIPGLSKDAPPSLFKPGSEQILSMFQIAVEPIVEDLSTDDCVCYRVITRLTHAPTGQFLGCGIGQCSSDETKYKWRTTYSKAEYEATPADRRRIKYGRDRTDMQVRQEPADVANTVLKMAKKRSQIDGTLTVTAASSMFQQDLEDLPPETVEQMAEEAPKQEIQPPKKKSTSPASPTGGQGTGQSSATSQSPASSLTEAQLKLVHVLQNKAGVSDDLMKEHLATTYGINSRKFIPKDKVNDVIAWLEEQKQIIQPDAKEDF